MVGKTLRRQVKVRHHRDRADNVRLEGLLRGVDKPLVIEKRLRTVEDHLPAESPEIAEPAAGCLTRITVNRRQGLIGASLFDQINNTVRIIECRFKTDGRGQKMLGADSKGNSHGLFLFYG